MDTAGIAKKVNMLYKGMKGTAPTSRSIMEHIGFYLKKIYFNTLKGQLAFRKGQVQKFLFFQDGFLIHARTNQPEEMLGGILFRTGRISKQTHSKLDAFIEPKKSIGEILIEKNLISTEDLKEGLNIQMREILLNTFPVFGADINFESKDRYSGETFDARVNIPSLIEDGIRRMKCDESLIQILKEKRFVPKSKDFFFRLSEQEKVIYDKIGREGEPLELLRSMEISKEDFWKGLYLLFCLDLIRMESGESGGEKKTSGSSQPSSDSRLDEILELYPRLNQMSYYQVLGISEDVDIAEVKKAYFLAARKYHPDLFSRKLPHDVREKIDDVFDFVTKAYHTLSHERKRKEYDRERTQQSPAEKSNAKKKAEVQFRKGKTLYDQSRFKEALVFLEEAVRLDTRQANYFLLLALTQAKIEMYHQQAEKNFLRSIEMAPWNAESYAGLGLMYKKAGLRVKAERYFRKALSIDSDHKAARSQLAELTAKSQKKSLKDYLSMDIFSKKDK